MTAMTCDGGDDGDPLHLAHHLRQLQHFQPRGTLRPVVPPADDHVAPGGAVPMTVEVAALIFELDVHALAPSRLDFAQGLAIGKTGLGMQHGETQPVRQYAKKKDDAGFVRGLMRQSGQSEQWAVDGPPVVKPRLLALTHRDSRWRLTVHLADWRVAMGLTFRSHC